MKSFVFIFQCYSPKGIAGEISRTEVVFTDNSYLNKKCFFFFLLLEKQNVFSYTESLTFVPEKQVNFCEGKCTGFGRNFTRNVSISFIRLPNNFINLLFLFSYFTNQHDNAFNNDAMFGSCFYVGLHLPLTYFLLLTGYGFKWILDRSQTGTSGHEVRYY